ncbi:MAG: TetR/AcrR family transcriptional regulator, partial [Candidatus Cloacimonadaceae bacterium]|nr:TetR/AcrR family transcriptional regulator [Candidatus Cloacimonadaceae bacterium]
MNTKERIIRKAMSLFNQNGVYGTTTNHIALALQISPGNLYYHFKDKEDIIRSIYDQMIKFMDKVWINEKQTDPIQAIVDILFTTMKLQYKYR